MDTEKFTVILTIKIITPDGTIYSDYERDDFSDEQTTEMMKEFCVSRSKAIFGGLLIRGIFGADDESEKKK